MNQPTELPMVFVVEDEESFIEALDIGLKREGFRVSVAKDGAEALTCLTKSIQTSFCWT